MYAAGDYVFHGSVGWRITLLDHGGRDKCDGDRGRPREIMGSCGRPHEISESIGDHAVVIHICCRLLFTLLDRLELPDIIEDSVRPRGTTETHGRLRYTTGDQHDGGRPRRRGQRIWSLAICVAGQRETAGDNGR